MDTTPQLPDDLITTAEAAKLLPGCRPGKRLHIASLYRWLADGRLRSWRLGRRRLVSRSEVLSLITAVPLKPGAKHIPQATRAEMERQTSEILKRFGLE